MVMSTRNPRHRALIALMGMCGLRVEEAVSVRPADFYGPDSDVWLRVRGKGSKERNVPVSSEAWSHLAKAVLLAAQAGTTVTRLSNSGARKAITRHAVNAGLSRHVASHDMRATFGTAAFRRSKNLRVVQELLGHASSSTTEVYTGVSAQEMREATGAA